MKSRLSRRISGTLSSGVITNANGYKMVDYPKLTAVLIEAIKELVKKLNTQSSNF